MNFVLLAPVGDTDPLRDNYDGPVLHIVRHYRPKKCYLVLTTEMARRDRDTNCYEKSISFVMSDCEVIRIEAKDKSAADYDAFHDFFNELINQIQFENPDAEILLNINSGTPQIRTTLCLEVVTHNVNLRPVQVLGPGKRTNRDIRFFDPYKDDLNDELENLMDNLDEAENRCKEPSLLAFKKSRIKNQVKGLVRSWEYKGAYELLSKETTMNQLFSERLTLLLRHAYYRSLPDEKKAEESAKLLGTDMYKKLYPTSNKTCLQICDYYLCAKLRRDRGELTDFILRATSLTETLLKIEVGNALGGLKTIAINIKGQVWKINKNRAEKNHPGLINSMKNWFNNKYDFDRGLTLEGYQAIANFLNIREYDKLLAVRESRNQAAHELESVTESKLNELGVSSKEILNLLATQIVKVFKPNSGMLKQFDILNDLIIKEMDGYIESTTLVN